MVGVLSGGMPGTVQQGQGKKASRSPRFPLKGPFKGDIDIDVDMDIDSDKAVSINWGSYWPGPSDPYIRDSVIFGP